MNSATGKRGTVNGKVTTNLQIKGANNRNNKTLVILKQNAREQTYEIAVLRITKSE